MFSLEGKWGVIQMRGEVAHLQLRRNMSAELLDCVKAMLEALVVCLELTAPAQ
jgi:hypothetical protein